MKLPGNVVADCKMKRSFIAVIIITSLLCVVVITATRGEHRLLLTDFINFVLLFDLMLIAARCLRLFLPTAQHKRMQSTPNQKQSIPFAEHF